jgi:hypothetical protein
MSFARQRTAERRSDTLLRIGTGLMMAFAAALVLLHAQVYACGLPQRAAALPSTASTAGPH